MSLKDISLDPFLLAELYQTALIPPEQSVASRATASVPFSGENRQHILVFFYDEKQAELPEGLYSFFCKILQACGLTIDDIALINKARLQGLPLSEVTEKVPAGRLIFFGNFFTDWLNKTTAVTQRGEIGGLAFLHAPDLEKLKSDKHLKKAFWKELQLFFNLKTNG